MSRCVISPSASRDLNAIIDYFVEHNVEAGERLLREFTKKCQNLTRFPNLGKSYSHLREGLRGMPLNGYVIFYQMQADAVEVLRVVSGRRDLEALFTEEE